MITVTKEQAQTRFASLPPALQDALFSEQNTEIISSIGEQYHLSDEKKWAVASLVGWVLLGFLHIEDLPGEIVAEIGGTPQLAKDITDSLSNKIFNVLKSDIEGIYAPAHAEEVPIEPTAGSAIPVSLVQKSKPTILSDVGWSKQSVPQPNVGTKAGLPTPAPTPTPPPVIKSAPISTPAPATPAGPAPVMLHEDTSFKAPEKNAGFTLANPRAAAEINMSRSSAGVPTPPRPAVLEFGGVKPPAPGTPAAVVHYTDFRSPLASAPTASSGPRNVSQITATPAAPAAPARPVAQIPTPTPVPVPRPPQAPTPAMPQAAQSLRPPQPLQPPQPPKPPAPPAPLQNNKPIVKDFL